MFNFPQKKNNDLKRSHLKKTDIRTRDTYLREKKRKNFWQISAWIFSFLSCIAAWITIPEFRQLVIGNLQMTVPRANEGAAGGSSQFISTFTPLATDDLIILTNTPSDAILSSGDTWVKDNILLNLPHVNIRNGDALECRFGVEFQFINQSKEDATISINNSSFVAVDNTGREWPNLGIGSHDCFANNFLEILIERVPSGDGYLSWVVWYSQNFKELGVSELTISVNGILNGITAIWRIPINQ